MQEKLEIYNLKKKTMFSTKKHYIFLFVLRMPFDWHNPGGYLIAFSIQCVSHYFLLQAVIVNLCFLMGVCEFFIAFTRDMEVELNAINECNKERNNGEEIKKRLCTFIELHGNIKE